MGGGRGLLASCALVVACFASGIAAAQGTAAAPDTPPVLTLTWIAPDGCPTQDEVYREVLRRLGGNPSTSRGVEARAVVTQRGDATWQIVLSTRQGGARGSRTLQAPSCAAVASAAALILALTIDPQAVARTVAEPPPPAEPSAPAAPPASEPAPSPPPPAPRPAPAPVATSSPVPIVPPVAAAPPRWEALFALLLEAGLGLEPGVDSGLEMTAGAAQGPLALELTVTSFLPSSSDVAGHPGKGGTFWPFAIGIEACDAFFEGPVLHAGACAGVEYQRLQAAGYGVKAPGSGSADWAAPVMAPFVGVRLANGVWARGSVEAAVPLRQPTFTLSHVGTAYQPAPVSARLGAGLEVRF